MQRDFAAEDREISGNFFSEMCKTRDIASIGVDSRPLDDTGQHRFVLGRNPGENFLRLGIQSKISYWQRWSRGIKSSILSHWVYILIVLGIALVGDYFILKRNR